MADRRWGDAAEMAVLELVDHPVIDRKRKVKGEVKAGDDESRRISRKPERKIHSIALESFSIQSLKSRAAVIVRWLQLQKQAARVVRLLPVAEAVSLAAAAK